MNLWVAVSALCTGIVIWILLVRRINARSWETSGSLDLAQSGDAGTLDFAPAKIGLGVFLAVITSLFALFMTAYYMRMGHGHVAGGQMSGPMSDWHTFIKPPILWFNTVVLFLSSGAMQWARTATASNRRDRAQHGLIAGGSLAVVFLIGQLLAWVQLAQSGFSMTTGPASAFFYLLTAVHGLHLLGGLFVWSRATARMWTRSVEIIDLRLSIELCTVYWHYLLLVWLALFALLLST